MNIRLDKETILRLYCSCRQAERSVHRALGGSWEALREYYRDRICALRGMLDALQQLVPGQFAGPRHYTREEALQSLPGTFQMLFSLFTARWRSAWGFAEVELQFIASTLNSFLETLDVPAKPDTTMWISLRMDLWACVYIVERRCRGLPELSLANQIEHFDRTPWLPHVELADVLARIPSQEKASERVKI